jgi:hypothetical protein
MGISTVGTYPNSTDLFNVATEAIKSSAERRSGESSRLFSDPTGDVLDLSLEAQAAADSTPPLPMSLESLFGVPAGEPITIDDMLAAQQKAQTKVEAKLDKLFAQQGIDTSQEIRLQVGADGQVVVTNDHPQREQIQQMFADDPQLRNDFVQAQSLAEMVGSAQEGAAFQKAYAQDPEAAVAQYWYLFDSAMKSDTSMVIKGDSYQMLYARPGMEPVEIGGEN